jgi:hypothetical protein
VSDLGLVSGVEDGPGWTVQNLSLTYLRLVALCEAGDLLCQEVVPKLPSQPRGKFAGDARRATAIFPFNRDDPDHGFLIITRSRWAHPFVSAWTYLSVETAL